MSGSAYQQVLLSPAELSYIQTSLSICPDPIRPDGRTPTQFRPLVAETGILPGTNGSARICFADGSEAIVGVKAEVEKTISRRMQMAATVVSDDAGDRDNRDNMARDDLEDEGLDEDIGVAKKKLCSNEWVELTVDIPGVRDDDPGTAYLANMLSEALLADGELIYRLWINSRFHWKIYLDVLLISQPLSYPLPLLSLTTHLAILSARLPKLISEGDEDPMFSDDWEASAHIYPPLIGSGVSRSGANRSSVARPPITLLVMTVGPTILFDPSYEELAVADAVLAVSVSEEPKKENLTAATKDTEKEAKRNLRLLSIRSIDPPSRLTPPGVPNELNPATNGEVAGIQQVKHDETRVAEVAPTEGVWKAPRGGVNRKIIAEMVTKVLQKGGVADEVLDGLEGVELS